MGATRWENPLTRFVPLLSGRPPRYVRWPVQDV